MNQDLDVRPWYREEWPWRLMFGPFVVIIAGLFTAWIAVSGSDDLVADDYYKQGLEVNQRIHRDQEALKNGFNADIVFGNTNDLGVRVFLKANEGVALPKKLMLRLIHPARAHFDQTIELAEAGSGFYVGKLSDSISGKRFVQLEGVDGTWRLAKDLELSPHLRIHLDGK